MRAEVPKTWGRVSLAGRGNGARVTGFWDCLCALTEERKEWKWEVKDDGDGSVQVADLCSEP